jgi:hypothetical protein
MTYINLSNDKNHVYKDLYIQRKYLKNHRILSSIFVVLLIQKNLKWK